MARVDIVHDAQGNVLSFSVHHPESAPNKTGVEVRAGQSVTSLEIPGHPAEDPTAFTTAVHSTLRRRLEG
jgi:hypothetical protein